MQFLYGHNIMRSGLLKLPEEQNNQYNGVIVVNKNDVPIV